MDEQKRVEEKKEHPPAPPFWLDKALIQRALRNAGDETSRVAAVAVSLPIAAGDNYGSTIYRAKTTLTDGEERSFIVKGPSPAVNMSNMTDTADVFVREATLLADIIPQMQALLEAAAPGRFPPLAPRCYLSGSDPVSFLVLEDLGPPGFKIADRKRGLGLRHSLMALRALARFHAASYALLQRQPGLEEQLDNSWRAMFKYMDVYVKALFQAAIETCLSWPGFEDCAERLKKFKPLAMETFAALNDAKPGAFNVITHGDFWVNNMMFRYEDDELREHRAIDLQLSRVASPAIDLVYFLSSSLSDNVHEHHQDLLLREYHSELKETMELLGLQSPPLESLLSAVNAHGSFSMFVVLARPIVKAEHGVDIDAMFSGDHTVMLPLLDEPDVKKWMQRVLRNYALRGWLPA